MCQSVTLATIDRVAHGHVAENKATPSREDLELVDGDDAAAVVQRELKKVQ